MAPQPHDPKPSMTGRLAIEFQKRFVPAVLILTMFILMVLIISRPTEGVAWHLQEEITDREYRDIELTDLEGDGNLEIGGILREPGDGDPSAEFHSYSDGSWDSFPAEIPYKGLYNDIAMKGPIVAASHAGGNSVDGWIFNTTSWNFDSYEPDPNSTTENYSLCLAMGDLNNDTYPDIVSGYKTQGIKVFYGLPNGGWEQGTFDKTTDMVKAIALADLDKDSHLDIINTHKVWGGSGSDPKKIEVWMGNGEGNWVKKTVVSTPGIDYSSLACSDLNDDGRLDIIAASDSNSGVDKYVYQIDGPPFWKRGSITNDGSYYSLILQDVNKDGLEDLVGCRFDDNGVNIYFSTGNASFNTDDDFGPTSSGDVWTCILHDFDGDENIDIIIADADGLYHYKQAIPEIKNVIVPEIMYAGKGSYDLLLEVSSQGLLEDPDNLQYVKIRFQDNITTNFLLTYEGESVGQIGSESYYVEEGSDVIAIDRGNCTRNDLPNGSVEIIFRISVKWDMPEFRSGSDSVVFAYMKEERGSTGWVEVLPGPWKFITSITVSDLTTDDDTLNPEDFVTVRGKVVYSDLSPDLPDGFVTRVEVMGNDILPGIDYDLSNGWFQVTVQIPDDTGEFILFPEVYVNLSGQQFIPISFPQVNVTVQSDYVVVTDMWITGEMYYDLGTQLFWQRSGEPLTFHTHAKYNHSGLAYDGELMLTNGSGSHTTTNRNLEMTFETLGILEYQLNPMDDSAHDNPYGPMLRTEITIFPEVVWDGGAPIIHDFTETSLQNGSEIKAIDASVIIIVEEHGLMEPFNNYGEMTIHWTIVQDENNSVNGSGIMERDWIGDNFTFSYDLPISQARTDNIVLFWFTGNDTVGNQVVSYLWPARSTEEDPAVVLVDPKPPATPTGLYTNSGDGYIEVRWLPNLVDDDFAGYRVYRSTDGDYFSQSPISGIGLVRYNYFLDEGLENGKTYYYQVSAVDNALIPNESNASGVVSDTPEEDEEGFEAIMNSLKENILLVFIGIVIFAVIIESGVMLRKGKKFEGTGIGTGTEGSEQTSASSATTPGTFAPPSGSQQSSPLSSQQSLGVQQTPSPLTSQTVPPPHTPPTSSTSTPTSTPTPQPSTPGKPFPSVDWTCPSCTKAVSLGQGERFCTNCGYKIR